MAERWASYSQISTFRACPQRWNYSYREKLRKVDPEDLKIELEFGSWWHALRAAESIDRGRRLGSLKSYPEELGTTDDGPKIDTAAEFVAEEVYGALSGWWHGMSASAKDAWVERLGEEPEARMRYLDEEWTKQWAQEREYELPVAVEFGWGRNLPDVEDAGLRPNTRMVGYVDEIYLDKRRNVLTVRDHKTSKSLASQTTADDMMDSQLQIYAWGAHPEVEKWGLGRIQAVAYDRVRTVKPKTPKLNLTGTLSRSVTDYDVRTYTEWVGEGLEYPGRLKDGSGSGVYYVDEAVVAQLSDPAARSVWFQRTLTPLNTNVIRAHLYAAVYTAEDMNKASQRIEATGEAARNLGGSCRWCDFSALCRAQMIGGPEGEYDLKEMRLERKER